MSQTQRQVPVTHETTTAPSGPPGSAATHAAGATVRIINGADVQDMALGGRTVAEARMVAQTVFGLRGDTYALLDGREVAEDHQLEAGQQLEFVRHAGQKGARDCVVTVRDDVVTWESGSGARGEAPLGLVLSRVSGSGTPRSRYRFLPNHVRCMEERESGDCTGVVIEMPPGPRQVRWIRPDSPDPYGPRATFTEYRLSFPWVVLLVIFEAGELGGTQQAFYRTRPLASADDGLSYTNLQNVAPNGGLESWVCFSNFGQCLMGLDWNERIAAVIDHFWSAAFTRELPEDKSWWDRSRQIDPRIATLEAWAAATAKNPYVALDIPWLRAPRSVGRTLERMLDQVAPWRPVERVEQLVTLLQYEDL